MSKKSVIILAVVLISVLFLFLFAMVLNVSYNGIKINNTRNEIISCIENTDVDATVSILSKTARNNNFEDNFYPVIKAYFEGYCRSGDYTKLKYMDDVVSRLSDNKIGRVNKLGDKLRELLDNNTDLNEAYQTQDSYTEDYDTEVSQTFENQNGDYKTQQEYLFPSNTTYITEYDLASKSKDEIALIRNEIYARHGYIFTTDECKNYFFSKTWYSPNPYFDESLFNPIERANKETIVNYEIKMGWR